MKKQSIIQKYKGLSFATAAEKIGKAYPNRDFDLTEKASYEVELEQLIQHQEEKKALVEAKQNQYKYGSKIKYEWGTDENGLPKKTYSTLSDQPLTGIQDAINYQGQINNMNPGQISYPNTWAETPRPQDNIQPLNTLNIPPMGFNGPPKPFTGQVDTLKSGIGIVNPNMVNVDESKVSTYTRDANGDITGTESALEKKKREMSAYTPALIGQGLSTAINAGILAKGYDKVAPVENPYESEVKNLMANRSVDTTAQENAILSSYNAARANLNNVRSANVRNALDANLMNATQDNMASNRLNEQQVNLGLKGDYANVLNNLGQQKAQSRTYAEDMTARNKGVFENNLSAFGADIAEDSKFFTDKKQNEVFNKLKSDILSSKYADFGLNPDLYKRLSEGKTTDEDIVILNKAYGQDATKVLIDGFKYKPQ